MLIGHNEYRLWAARRSIEMSLLVLFLLYLTISLLSSLFPALALSLSLAPFSLTLFSLTHSLWWYQALLWFFYISLAPSVGGFRVGWSDLSGTLQRTPDTVVSLEIPSTSLSGTIAPATVPMSVFAADLRKLGSISGIALTFIIYSRAPSCKLGRQSKRRVFTMWRKEKQERCTL